MRKKSGAPSLGFTLIELLIVIAIIAILALIAIPNFLEAQTRSKVSRAKADLRTLATAFNAYYVDFNASPPDGDDGVPGYVSQYTTEHNGQPPTVSIRAGLTWANLDHFYGMKAFSLLTTPIAYISSIPRDPFHRTLPFSYCTRTIVVPNNWVIMYTLCASIGPDQVIGDWRRVDDTGNPATQALLYDPSNGTISAGDIYRAMLVGDSNLFRKEYPMGDTK